MHKSNVNSIFAEKTSLENVEVTFIGKTELSDPKRRKNYWMIKPRTSVSHRLDIEDF